MDDVIITILVSVLSDILSYYVINGWIKMTKQKGKRANRLPFLSSKNINDIVIITFYTYTIPFAPAFCQGKNQENTAA